MNNQPPNRLSGRRTWILQISIVLGGLLLPGMTAAQVIYGTVYHPAIGCSRVYKIDLANCTVCPVSGCDGGLGDFVILSDGTRLLVGGLYSYQIAAPPSSQVLWTSPPGWGVVSTAIQIPGGPVYLISDAGALLLFDPVNYSITSLGTLQSGTYYELIYTNGVLYALAMLAGQTVLVQVNIANPSQSTIVNNNVPFTFATEGGFWNGNAGYFYATFTSVNNQLLFFNQATGTSELVCDLNAFLSWPNAGPFTNLTTMPPGLPEWECLAPCVFGYAGEIPQAGPLNLCTNQTLNYPATQGQILGPGNALRYILFSNPADTVGSIVATSATPSFTFNPATMQTGVTYYMAAAVAEELANGLIDFSDPCLDISNALSVTWQPLPALNFSIAGATALCVGDCSTIQIDFTGTPPFSLGYTTPGGTFLQNFSNNVGFIQVCLPANTAPGTFQIQATSLTDAFCVCN